MYVDVQQILYVNKKHVDAGFKGGHIINHTFKIYLSFIITDLHETWFLHSIAKLLIFGCSRSIALSDKYRHRIDEM